MENINIPENFYPIKNCGVKDGYYITIDGVVASTLKGNFLILKSRTNNRGYADVPLVNEEGRRRPYTIHRLMALTFLDNPNEYPVINHINGIKHDNRLSNIEWCTISHNTKHAYDVCGAVNGRQRAIKATVISTCETLSFESIKVASQDLGVSSTQLYYRLGRTLKDSCYSAVLDGIRFEYATN